MTYLETANGTIYLNRNHQHDPSLIFAGCDMNGTYYGDFLVTPNGYIFVKYTENEFIYPTDLNYTLSSADQLDYRISSSIVNLCVLMKEYTQNVTLFRETYWDGAPRYADKYLFPDSIMYVS